MQKACNDGTVGVQFPIAQQAKQIFAAVSQLFQPLEAQKSSGSLDRVHGTEYVAQQGGIVRPCLKIRQAPLHPVQPFLTLD